MKKKILTCFLCGFLFFGNIVHATATDIDARIAEIEKQISDLQNELASLREEKIQNSGDIYVSKEEYTSLFADPDSYIGRNVKIAGQMINSMEQDSNGKYFQFLYNFNGDDKSVVVKGDLNTPDFSEGDYVLVTGKVLGSISGENAFGGEVLALAIEADFSQKTDYATAVDPAIKTIDVGLEIDQCGYVVRVDKIEFSENETRLYVTTINNGSSKFYLSNYSTKIVQDSSQYEYEYNYEAEYPEIQSELLPGITSSGIICFPVMDYNNGVDIYFEGYSDNWDETINPYHFTVQQ